MGTGDGPPPWSDLPWADLTWADPDGADLDGADLEWLRLADLPSLPALPPGAGNLAYAVQGWAAEHLTWRDRSAGERVLLVDLDNIRAEPARLRARMALLATLAASADHVVLAGQDDAVDRAVPWLGEAAGRAHRVPSGRNEADYLLLDEAEELLGERPGQFMVASNDGIFAALARRGPLTLLSPGPSGLSGRLVAAAERLVDLEALEDRLGGGTLRTMGTRPPARARPTAGTRARGRGRRRVR